MVNERKPDARATVRALMNVLVARKISVLLHQPAAALIGANESYSAQELAHVADVIAVLGGDGTMLAAMEKLGATDIPVAGINIGTLGFLTSCTDAELEFFADSLLKNDYSTSE